MCLRRLCHRFNFFLNVALFDVRVSWFVAPVSQRARKLRALGALLRPPLNQDRSRSMSKSSGLTRL